MGLDWDILNRDFQKQRCILLLGPKVSSTDSPHGRLPMIEQLSIFITELLNKHGIQIPSEKETVQKLSFTAQQFLNIDRVRRVDLEDVVEDFYHSKQDLEIPAAYQAIAALPAKVIIDVNTDNFLINALRAQDKTPIVRHYNFQMTNQNRRAAEQDPIDVDDINERSPLVYNLLGSLEEKESLVLTEADQMEFIRNVVKGDPPIPDEVLSYFDRRKTYIFMGFDMSSWQFRLLLDTFNIKFKYLGKDNQPISPQFDNYPISSTTQIFYEEQFNFLFLEEKIESFIQEMKAKVAPDEGQKTHKIYIAFSDNEEDRDYLEHLEKQLKPLEQNDDIEIWHKNRASFGDELDAKTYLQKADTILLLMSSDFLADEQLLEEDLEWAIDAQQEQNTRLIPVLARHCTWRAIRELRSLPALPSNEQPIADDTWANVDEACYEIAQQLKKRLGL